MKLVCGFCNVFVYDTEKGDEYAGLKKGTYINDIPETWRCPICGKTKSYLKQIDSNIFIRKIPIYKKYIRTT